MAEEESWTIGAAKKKGFVKFFTWLNVVLYGISGGRLMNSVAGGPVCLVTMTRRSNGKRKTIALVHTPFEDKVLLVASLGGAPQHPAWYHSLIAHPDVEIQHGTVKRRMSARLASPAERSELWPKVVASYANFADYQKNTTREIPIFICEPRV